LVISIVAVVVALGGTGYAALRLPDASVGTNQLKDGAVTARKVHAHTLLAKDFKRAVPGAPGAARSPV
jgi:hypothetical protein